MSISICYSEDEKTFPDMTALADWVAELQDKTAVLAVDIPGGFIRVSLDALNEVKVQTGSTSIEHTFAGRTDALGFWLRKVREAAEE